MDIAREIAALKEMTVVQLQERYAEIFGEVSGGIEHDTAFSSAPITPANRTGKSYLYHAVIKAFAKPFGLNAAALPAVILSSR